MTKLSLANAVLLAVKEEPGITSSDIAKTIAEPINLVSGTLKYLLKTNKISRKKEGPVYKYYAPFML